jgi:hypothetical protein
MTGPLPAVTPNDELGFVLQWFGFGALLGTSAAAYVRRRQPEADTWLLVASISLLGAACALVHLAAERLGWW